ncbi:MAG TPA: divergent PAP2 family protein [Acholeplasma sp.]|nr:divergent PAP2 family protein [Acholeplasma sp.]
MNHANQIIFDSLLAMTIAQVLKFIISSIKYKSFHTKALVSTGGMPSSHSALVAAMSFSIYLYQGVDLFFALALVTSLVVIHDSMGIRLEASKHAVLLNKIAEKIEMSSEEINEGRPLKEPLGHLPIEVLAGVILGVLISLFNFYV